MRKWKYFCPKRYYGHYVRIMEKWENISAVFLWCKLLSPALSLPGCKDGSYLISCCSFLYSPGLLIQCKAHLWVPLTKLGCSVCWLLNTSRLLLRGPKHMFRIGNMSICTGTRPSVSSGPLPLCAAVMPECMTCIDIWACSLSTLSVCMLVCLLAGGLTIGTRMESMKGIPPIEPSWGWDLARTLLSVQWLAAFQLSIRALSVWKTWKCQRIIFASKKDGSRCENRFSHHNVNWCFVFILVEQYIGIHENIWL